MSEFVRNWLRSSAGRLRRPRDHWSDARLNHLRRRWQEGATARRIAVELGGVTRHAILGKVRRLGLTRLSDNPSRSALARRAGRARSTSSRGVTHERRPVKSGHNIRSAVTSVPRSPRPDQLLLFAWPARAIPVWVRDAKPYVEEVNAGAHVPVAQRRSLMNLDAAACRWPFGDPASSGFFFCGAPAVTDKPYCAEHWLQAYPITTPLSKAGEPR
jgi:GcrA cell cycle regulator